MANASKAYEKSLIALKFTEVERSIMIALRQHGPMSAGHLAKVCNITAESAEATLAILADERLVRNAESLRSTLWCLTFGIKP
jgi:DNA-binding MarR family transcriptional regulator